MADVHTPATRSKNMRAIKARETRPELLIRKSLHAVGLRYKLHDKSLPGVPDLVFPKHRAVVFVHGCFWHVHGCQYSKMPKTRAEFWGEKLSHNRDRDRRVCSTLLGSGWRVGIVWECAVHGPSSDLTLAANTVANWLRGRQSTLESPAGVALSSV